MLLSKDCVVLELGGGVAGAGEGEEGEEGAEDLEVCDSSPRPTPAPTPTPTSCHESFCCFYI